MRLFIYDGKIVNVDNDTDADRLLSDPGTERELSTDEISEIFGKYSHLASPTTTTIDDNGMITFTLPQEYTDFKAWLDTFVRPARDIRLTDTDKYMVSDYPITDIERARWVAYRQKLRDFPATLTTPIRPIPWPVEPE